MSRDVGADQARLLAVQAAARAGQHEKAAQLAEAALATGLEHPLLYNIAALKLETAGRVAEAEKLLRRSLEIAPEDFGSRNALGLCLLRLERPGKALSEFDRLIAVQPMAPFLYASRGTALVRLGRTLEAESSYRRALELDANQPVALAGLASLESGRGAFPAAREHAQRALSFLPGFPDAVMSLAGAELGLREKDKAEGLVRELLLNPRLAPVERAYANGLLGDVLDAKNQPEDAFAAYTRCNRELREFYAGRFDGQMSSLEYVQAMNWYFQGGTRAAGAQLSDAGAAGLASGTGAAQSAGTAGAGGATRTPGPAISQRDFPSSWKTPTPPDKRVTGAADHVFLLGFPRSGTTLLEVILEGHPKVASLEENESLLESVQEYMRRPQDVDGLTQADPVKLDSLRTSYWRLVAEAGVQVAGKVFVDKHPLNTLKLPLIARLFPNAKILFAVRDPRDIVLSCFRHRFYMSAPIFELLTLEGAARYYDGVMKLGLTLTGNLPLDVRLVRHEDIVREFRWEMRRLCEYLGLEWVESMGDFALRTQNRAQLTPSTAQLVRGLSTEGLGQWRRYQRHLEPVLPILAPWVKQFLYEDA
jgi:tetratricopeptide (TPR) repeat protein